MTTVTLTVSISVAVFCTVVFVMIVAAVIVCAKKKGLYTSRRFNVLYDKPSSIILNERYQPTTEWSTPYRSTFDTSMVTNALYEPNTLMLQTDTQVLLVSGCMLLFMSAKEPCSLMYTA